MTRFKLLIYKKIIVLFIIILLISQSTVNIYAKSGETLKEKFTFDDIKENLNFKLLEEEDTYSDALNSYVINRYTKTKNIYKKFKKK